PVDHEGVADALLGDDMRRAVFELRVDVVDIAVRRLGDVRICRDRLPEHVPASFRSWMRANANRALLSRVTRRPAGPAGECGGGRFADLARARPVQWPSTLGRAHDRRREAAPWAFQPGVLAP